MKNHRMIMFWALLALAMVSFACAAVLTTKETAEPFSPGTQGKEHGRLKTGNELAQNNISEERYNVQFSDKKTGGITKFENVPVDEERLINDMKIILQEKMSKDYPTGLTKRDAHPKTLACLQAQFIVEPSMPLGTIKLFHDAVYYSIKLSPLVFLARLVVSGDFHIINELRKARQNQTSPLDIRYWSTTPYLCGTDRIVKYSLVPTSRIKSLLSPKLSDHYLTENMEKHLAANEASFDFMIQFQKDPSRMPVEDAGVEWSEKESPFIKVATLRIPPQAFRTREREELAEDLSFSPAHSLIDHRPIGGINRARVEIYQYLSEFRHKQNNKQLIEPRK